MPARIEEIHHAEEEGVQFYLLTAPQNSSETITDGSRNGMPPDGAREPDESGRRRPVPKKGSEFTLECDMAVIAIGAGPIPSDNDDPGLELNKRGYIIADLETGKTTKQGSGPAGYRHRSATVILAMGAGRKAANSIHEYLMSK